MVVLKQLQNGPGNPDMQHGTPHEDIIPEPTPLQGFIRHKTAQPKGPGHPGYRFQACEIRGIPSEPLSHKRPHIRGRPGKMRRAA